MITINFSTDDTTEHKLDVFSEFVGSAVAVHTETETINCHLAECGPTPEPWLNLRYAAWDEDLGMTSIIVKKILIVNTRGVTVLV